MNATRELIIETSIQVIVYSEQCNKWKCSELPYRMPIQRDINITNITSVSFIHPFDIPEAS